MVSIVVSIKVSIMVSLKVSIMISIKASIVTSIMVSIKVSIMGVSIKAGTGLDRVGWIRSSMVRGKIRLT